MTGIAQPPPAPVGQQAPPMRVAASDPWRSLRVAHGALPLTTGTGYRRGQEHNVIDGNREH
jgi:hypothetical protein